MDVFVNDGGAHDATKCFIYSLWQSAHHHRQLPWWEAITWPKTSTGSRSVRPWARTSSSLMDGQRRLWSSRWAGLMLHLLQLCESGAVVAPFGGVLQVLAQSAGQRGEDGIQILYCQLGAAQRKRRRRRRRLACPSAGLWQTILADVVKHSAIRIRFSQSKIKENI